MMSVEHIHIDIEEGSSVGDHHEQGLLLFYLKHLLVLRIVQSGK
jgi:hypothetical protein